MLSCKWNERKYKKHWGKLCFPVTRKVLFGRDSSLSAHHNEEICPCCCSSGPNTIKMLKFYKARGHRTHSVTHYSPCEACRNKLCLQKSPHSALGSIFILLSRSPARSHHTGFTCMTLSCTQILIVCFCASAARDSWIICQGIMQEQPAWHGETVRKRVLWELRMNWTALFYSGRDYNNRFSCCLGAGPSGELHWASSYENSDK